MSQNQDSEGNFLDDFMNHKGSSGGFAKQLGAWKKRSPPTVNTFLHMRAPIPPMWRHNLPLIKTYTPKGQRDAVRQVWNVQWLSHEDEAVLKSQHRRTKDGSDAREIPPQLCAIGLMLEWIREQVKSGALDLWTPLFHYAGDDPTKAQTLQAGPMCGLINADLSEEQKKACKDNGVYLKDAWKSNAMAKLSYLFTVVDADDVNAGIQISIEPGILGDKVKSVIHATRKSLGDEEGNPFKHPFCIEWESCPNEQEFNKKYNATRIERIKATPAILRLIRDSAPPDVSSYLEPYEPDVLRASLEQACLLSGMPFDDFFAPLDGAGDGGRQPSKAAKPLPAARAPKVEDEPMFACDACEKPMKASDSVCPHCGQKYDVEPATPPSPPPAPLPKRSAAKPAATPAPVAAKPGKAPSEPKVTPSRGAKPAPPVNEDAEDAPDDFDDVPF